MKQAYLILTVLSLSSVLPSSRLIGQAEKCPANATQQAPTVDKLPQRTQETLAPGGTTAYQVESVNFGTAPGPLTELKPTNRMLFIVRAKVAVSGQIKTEEFELADVKGKTGTSIGVAGGGEEKHLMGWRDFYITDRIAIPRPGTVILAYTLEAEGHRPHSLAFRGSTQPVRLLSDLGWKLDCLQSRDPDVRRAAVIAVASSKNEPQRVRRELQNAFKTEKDAEIRAVIQSALACIFARRDWLTLSECR